MKPRFSAATNRSPTWDPDFTRGNGCAAYEAETLAEFVLHAWTTKLMGEISRPAKSGMGRGHVNICRSIQIHANVRFARLQPGAARCFSAVATNRD
jgi:hypothetical protein